MIVIIEKKQFELDPWDTEAFNELCKGCENKKVMHCSTLYLPVGGICYLYNTDCESFDCLPETIRQQLKSQA